MFRHMINNKPQQSDPILRRSYLGIFLLLVMNSCIYSEEEDYFKDIVPGTPPNVSLSTNLDTINIPEVFDSLEIHYTIEITGGELIWSQFLLEDSIVFSSASAPNSFWLVNNMYYSGLLKLRMEAYYNSNTGSLADIIGIEALRDTHYNNVWFRTP